VIRHFIFSCFVLTASEYELRQLVEGINKLAVAISLWCCCCGVAVILECWLNVLPNIS
jgi:hypothetical protein